MKLLAIIIAMASLTACHSERHAVTETTDSLRAVTAMHIDANGYFTTALKADSVRITVSADSVRTSSEEIIYGPRVSINIDAPAREVVAVSSTTADYSAETTAEHHRQATEETVKDAATGGTIARGIGAVALLLLLVCTIRKLLK